MGESSRNYQNGKIYCIRNWLDDDIYVGSTTQALSKRMDRHRSHARTDSKKSNYKLYQKMKEVGIEQFYIELIEKYECNSKEELFKKEGEWIRKMGTLNFQIAGRPIEECRKEYYNRDPERWREYHKKWNEDNREKEQLRQRKRYETKKEEIRKRRNEKIQCVCGVIHNRGYKSIHLKSQKHQTYIKNNLNNNINNVQVSQEEQENRKQSTSPEVIA